MAQTSGRLTCPRCGANNFETVSACWKCSAPLHGGGGASAGSSAAASASAGGGYGAERGVGSAPVAYMSPPVVSTGDSGVATRAAIALALTFPWIGLPVGWVFMMIEDRRKQAIGRVCAVWSMIALVFHLLFTFVLIQSAMSQILPILVGVMKARSESGGGSGVPNINLPGGMGGGP